MLPRLLVLGVMVGCGGADVGVPEAPGAARRNVVIVLSDALRASNLDLYGYPRETAPHLTALAAEAAVFTHAFAHAPGTPPSVSQLMTGRYMPPQVMQTRVFGVAVRDLPADYPLLPRLFSQAGYGTGLITTHAWFQDSSRLLATFDTAEVVRSDESYAPFQAMLPSVEAFLDAHTDSPFLLYVHAMDTHTPNTLDPADQDLLVEGLSEDVAAYDSEIRRVDRGLKAILETLASRGRLEDTVVVFTADHGTEFGEISDAHYDRHHGMQLRRPLVEVPLVVRLPGGQGAGRYEAPVGLVDLLPTLMHLADPTLARPEGDGIDLAPLILAGRDGDPERRMLARSIRYWGMYDADEELLLDRWSGQSQHSTLTRDANNYARQVASDLRPEWDARLRERASALDAGFVALPQNAALAGEVDLLMPWDFAQDSAAPIFPSVEDDQRWTYAARELLLFPGEEVTPVRYAMPFVDGRWRVKMRSRRDAPFNEGVRVRVEGGEPLTLVRDGDGRYDLGVHDVTDPFELVVEPGEHGVSLRDMTLIREDQPGQPVDPELRKALEALGYGAPDE